MIDSTRSIKACAAYYGENADEMEAYLLDGEKRALELGNRGPISNLMKTANFPKKFVKHIRKMVFTFLKM